MIAVLDACVLYPTVLREVLLGAARAGAFEPAWSPRILEEWRRAAARTGPPADAEIAAAIARFPHADRDSLPGLAEGLSPDEGDLHVIDTALGAGADWIVTLNLRDFPARRLSPLGIHPRHPDAVMLEWAEAAPDAARRLGTEIVGQVAAATGLDRTPRALMKRAGLPRYGKWL